MGSIGIVGSASSVSSVGVEDEGTCDRLWEMVTQPMAQLMHPQDLLKKGNPKKSNKAVNQTCIRETRPLPWTLKVQKMWRQMNVGWSIESPGTKHTKTLHSH